MTKIDDDADEYVRLLTGVPNGWGQHVHPEYGISHRMLNILRARHGGAAFDDAVDAALKRLRGDQ